MNAWPSLKKVVFSWSVVTIGAYAIYVWYLSQLPPDELDMASTLGFRALVGLLVVGLPALLFLFLLVFFGAIAKTYLLEKPAATSEDRK